MDKVKSAKEVKPCTQCGTLTHLLDASGNRTCGISPCNPAVPRNMNELKDQTGMSDLDILQAMWRQKMRGADPFSR